MGDNVRPWQGVLPQIGPRAYADPAAVVIDLRSPAG